MSSTVTPNTHACFWPQTVLQPERNFCLPLARARQLAEIYQSSLFEDVIPWWTKHSPDVECGGFYSCLAQDGRPYSGDKYFWMLGRQIWMYSHLYNRQEPRDQWRRLARHGADFLLRYAPLPDGKLNFRVTRQGRPLAKCLSLYTEIFAAIGLAELSRAEENESLWNQAIQMANRIMPRLGQASDTPLLGYALDAQFHLHAHDMMRITLAWVLNEIEPSAVWGDALVRSADSIVSHHWRPELGVMLENIGMDGQPMLDFTEGRMVHPGHAIESAWMLMEVALAAQQQTAVGVNGDPNPDEWFRIDQADRTLRRHLQTGRAVRQNDSLMQTSIDVLLHSLERGWDQQYGGLRYCLTLDGSPSHVLEADMKLWWPHSEALYALLLAWAYTGRADIGAWYERVHDYTFEHFPDRRHGEWYGYLNRDGSPVFTAKATPWKCCFHLPRALHRCCLLLNQVVNSQASGSQSQCDRS